MYLEIGNQYTRVGEASVDEIAWLAHLLSFEDNSKAFYRRGGKTHRRKGGPGKTCMFYRLTQSFPAGLTSMVVDRGKLEGKTLHLLDSRTRPGVLDPSIDISWLHGFQRDAVLTCAKRTKGIVKIATSGGKTEVAVALAKAMPDVSWLFLAPEKDLMWNASRRFELRTGEPAGVLGDGEFKIERFTAATLQTLAYKLGVTKRQAKGDNRIDERKVREFVKGVGGMIIDEVHQLPAETFYAAAMEVPAYYRIGMSGTPLARGDRKSLLSIAATGGVIVDVGSKFLIENEFASKPTIVLVRNPIPRGKPYADWQKAYKAIVVRGASRNTLLAMAAVVCEKPALVFVREIEHGRTMLDLLRKRGLRSEFVWGDSSTRTRDRMIELLEWGDLDCIVCSVVFNTGTDIPEVRSVINGAAGKSIIQTLQRLGRGMRVTRAADGSVIKRTFTVYDIIDEGNKWLAQWSRARLASYMSEGHATNVIDSFTELANT